MNKPFTDFSPSADIISVSQLNKLAKNTLESYLPICWVKGEVSGIKSYAHVYFDLKDEAAKIACVIFAKTVAALGFSIQNGNQIEVRGKITIYPQTGAYQINVERVRKVGDGELWEAYNRLLVALRTEGLFGQKRLLPLFPVTIGLITSKEGAVIRDVIVTLKRRMSGLAIIVYHSAVQGIDAAMQLIKAIRVANQRQEVDVLIICRGGGSMEDLWSFNLESVAREVFASKIPIISAIGHETDTTIIDFVADLRAPTPTAAAELAIQSQHEWLQQITSYQDKVNYYFNSMINQYQQQLDIKQAQLKLHNPLNAISQYLQHIAYLRIKMIQAYISYIRHHQWKIQLLQAKLLPPHFSHKQDYLKVLASTLNNNILRRLKRQQEQCLFLQQQLNLLNPHAVLTRGYVILEDSNTNRISSSLNLKHNARLHIIMYDGNISVIVDKKYNHTQPELAMD